uniref:Uncharacterized protein n=1 Tax=Oryza punctata TaxID=4537 RepID=A0A0E0LAK8_ORYPU
MRISEGNKKKRNMEWYRCTQLASGHSKILRMVLFSKNAALAFHVHCMIPERRHKLEKRMHVYEDQCGHTCNRQSLL